ncbi:MAG: HdeD family acid-resistance protein [Bauldia sp.]
MTNASMTQTGLGGPLLRRMSENWWLFLVRGVLAIIFGVIAIAVPIATVITLAIIFGIYAIIDGVMALASAIRGDSKMPRWWLVIVGIAGIAAGILAIVWPDLTALLLITFIGAWAVVRGVFEIIGAIALRREIDNEWMLILGGVLSVLFGVFVLIAPGAGAIALAWLIGIAALLLGIMLVGLAFRLRRHHSA